MASIRMRDIVKTFGKTEVIRGIDLDIEDGELCVFVGPSGCGKSTLLRIVAGLEDVTGGKLFIGEEDVTQLAPSRRGVAIVFQSYALYPHMTVFDNMAFGLTLAKQDKAEIQKRVHEAAKLLQIDKLLERLPKELSGGQRQRVAIGRAITRNPKVFLFDEPLSNLDAALRVQTRIEIANLHKRLKTTMIYVTHDQVEAMTLATKIVVLNAGKVAQVGSPLELYHRPADLFVAGFIGSPRMNFLSATLVRAGERSATVRLADGSELEAAVRAGEAKEGAAVTLGIRPEHVLRGAAGGDGGRLRGIVRTVERLGEGSYVYLTLGGGKDAGQGGPGAGPDSVSGIVPDSVSSIVASEADSLITIKESGDSEAVEDSTLELCLPAAHCHLFDAAGRAFPRAEAATASPAASAAAKPA